MKSVSLLAAILLSVLSASSFAQTIAPQYSSIYSYTDLGTVAGVTGPYGGISFASNDPNTLLLGGAANTQSGVIYSIPVNRDPTTHQVTSFGTPTVLSTAPQIDGGLIVMPNGTVLFTGYTNGNGVANSIGEIKSGSSSPDKTVSLTSAGVTSSVGTLQIVPAGFAAAGHLKIISYNASTWYDATAQADGNGTFDFTITDPAITLSGGPEGLVFIKNTNPLFPNDSVLVNQYLQGRVEAYDLDANGNPITSTARDFMTGLTGCEGAIIDPVTGDFLFSTFGGGSRIVRVQGFLVPEPTTASLLCGASLLLLRRRRQSR